MMVYLAAFGVVFIVDGLLLALVYMLEPQQAVFVLSLILVLVWTFQSQR